MGYILPGAVLVVVAIFMARFFIKQAKEKKSE